MASLKVPDASGETIVFADRLLHLEADPHARGKLGWPHKLDHAKLVGLCVLHHSIDGDLFTAPG